MERLNRRRFLRGVLALAPAGVGLDVLGEVHWLNIRHHRIGNGATKCRFVHFTDVHYRGDDAYLAKVVERINGLSPDFAIFTGDLVEQARFARPALELLGGLKMPVFGVPGNHDHSSRADFGEFRRVFTASGGAWMQDEQRLIAGGRVQLTAADRWYSPRGGSAGAFRVLMVHYPGWTDRLRASEGPTGYHLILAGHTHGGQVRIPFHGAVITPYDTDGYERGWYQTPAGPLYVNPGIGTIAVNVRFCCRPELAVFEIGESAV